MDDFPRQTVESACETLRRRLIMSLWYDSRYGGKDGRHKHSERSERLANALRRLKKRDRKQRKESVQT